MTKYGQTPKKSLQCLVDAKAYDFLKRHVLDNETSVAAFINAYINSIYKQHSKEGKRARKDYVD